LISRGDFTPASTPTNTHAYLQAHVQTHTHTHMRMHTHMRTHKHTHIVVHFVIPFSNLFSNNLYCIKRINALGPVVLSRFVGRSYRLATFISLIDTPNKASRLQKSAIPLIMLCRRCSQTSKSHRICCVKACPPLFHQGLPDTSLSTESYHTAQQRHSALGSWAREPCLASASQRSISALRALSVCGTVSLSKSLSVCISLSNTFSFISFSPSLSV
jgi:hypothetical protein